MSENESKVTKEQLLENLKQLAKQYQIDNPKSKKVITRNYYRRNSDYGECYITYYDTFDNFKNQLDIDVNTFEQEKKVKILEEQVKDLKADRDKLLNSEIKEEQFINEFKSRIKPIEVNKNIPKKVVTRREKEIALVLSDWHSGEVVVSEEMGGINAFNKKILFERADDVFKQFHDYCDAIKVNNVRVYIIGDMLGGIIHEELRNTNEETVIESLISLQEYLTKQLFEFSKRYNKTKVVIISGNHTRITEKPQNKKHQINNFEYIMGIMIQHNLSAQKNIEVVVPKSVFYIDNVLGKNNMLMHGDTLSSGSGSFAGIGFYAIATNAAKLFGALIKSGINETNFSNIFCGHLHSFSFIPLFQGGHVLINASLIGTNEFSLNKIKTVSSIEQSMVVLTENGIESAIRLVPKINR